MNVFLFVFSDQVFLPLLQGFVALLFVKALLIDIRDKTRKGSPSISVTRGPTSMGYLIAFWGISIIIIGIIVSSNLIAEHRVVIGLLNVAALLYLSLFSPHFRNRIISWAAIVSKVEANDTSA